jgi:hypothetical protein
MFLVLNNLNQTSIVMTSWQRRPWFMPLFGLYNDDNFITTLPLQLSKLCHPGSSFLCPPTTSFSAAISASYMSSLSSPCPSMIGTSLRLSSLMPPASHQPGSFLRITYSAVHSSAKFHLDLYIHGNISFLFYTLQCTLFPAIP